MNIRVQTSCIIVKDNHIAMIKKKDPKYRTYNKYIPPGGHVENFEKLESACIREVKEETNLIVDKLELKGIVTFLGYKDNYHSVCFFYVAKEVKGNLLSNEPEKQTSHWLSLDNIQSNENMTDYHKAILKEIIDKDKFANANIEWMPPNDELKWIIESS